MNILFQFDFFLSSQFALEISSEVRCIDCSPHNEDLFLVSYYNVNYIIINFMFFYLDHDIEKFCMLMHPSIKQLHFELMLTKDKEYSSSLLEVILVMSCSLFNKVINL